MATKYTNLVPLQDPKNLPKLEFLGLKIYHLATLLQTYEFRLKYFSEPSTVYVQQLRLSLEQLLPRLSGQ
jgi:hypothetical protein